MNIIFHRKFEKQFSKLSKKLKDKVKERNILFKEDPFNIILNNHALNGKYTGYRSINVTGDIRIIYKLLDDNTSLFAQIGDHNKFYG